jgi:hypothetical protein
LPFGKPLWHLRIVDPTDMALILSVVALGIGIVTLPTAFQMFWGRPSIFLSLNDHHVNGVKALRCMVGNKPVTNQFLKLVGVIRQPDVLAHYGVYESGSGKVIIGLVRPHLKTDKEYGKQVTLASFVPAIFSVVIHDDHGTRLVLEENLDSEPRVVLERGRYRIECEITHSHYHAFKFHAEFSVGDTDADLYWVGHHPKILQYK